MRHIWICLIDGVIIRSGTVIPGDTMPQLMERMMRTYPHMQPESLKVIREDGSIFDNELWFSNPSTHDAEALGSDDILFAVGAVNGHIGVQVHHGKSPEEILKIEANTFPEKITDEMDYGIFNLAGEQMASIEDMIQSVAPDSSQQPAAGPGGARPGRNRRGGNRRPDPRRRNGRGRRRNDDRPQQGSPSSQGDASSAPTTDGSDTPSNQDSSPSDDDSYSNAENSSDANHDDEGNAPYSDGESDDSSDRSDDDQQDSRPNEDDDSSAPNERPPESSY